MSPTRIPLMHRLLQLVACSTVATLSSSEVGKPFASAFVLEGSGTGPSAGKPDCTQTGISGTDSAAKVLILEVEDQHRGFGARAARRELIVAGLLLSRQEDVFVIRLTV